MEISQDQNIKPVGGIFNPEFDIENVRSYLDIINGLLISGSYKIKDWLVITVSGKIDTVISLNKDNQIVLEFQEPRPIIILKKFIHLRAKITSVSDKGKSIVIGLDGAPDVILNVKS